MVEYVWMCVNIPQSFLFTTEGNKWCVIYDGLSMAILCAHALKNKIRTALKSSLKETEGVKRVHPMGFKQGGLRRSTMLWTVPRE